jgi:hypothetical protein
MFSPALFSGGGTLSPETAAFSALTQRPLTATGGLFPGHAKGSAQTHFAPILGDGRFTQPGADGGDALRSTELFSEAR